MQDAKKVRRRIAAALGGDGLVRIVRKSEPATAISGFVRAVGAKWVLLARTMDGGYLDGWVAVRLRDIRSVRKDRTFEGAHARRQPGWPPELPEPLDLDTTRGALRTLVAPSTLVGVQANYSYEALWIGLADEFVGRHFYLWEIRPDATWHEQPRGYRVGRLSTIEVGSHYLRGLAAMAPKPPAGAIEAPWPGVTPRS